MNEPNPEGDEYGDEEELEQMQGENEGILDEDEN